MIARDIERANPMQTTQRLAPSPLTDDEIVARVRLGDLMQFEHLMRRHNARVYRAARAILRDETEAEDVMQDAFVRAYEHLNEFECRSSFSTWLTRIAVHEALARSRRSKRWTALEPALEDVMTMVENPSPEQALGAVEMHQMLENAVTNLPQDFRIVFVLRAVEGMSVAETAECLGIPEETVKTRLHRARTRLQEKLFESVESSAPRVYAFHLTRCDRVVAAVMRRLTGG